MLFRSLQAGDIIDATIVTRLPDGQIRLTTSRYGSLLANWPNPPAPGTTLQLQVLSPGPPVRLQIAPQGPAQPPRTRLGQTPLAPSAVRISTTDPSRNALQQPDSIKPGLILQGRLFPAVTQPAKGGLFGPQTPAPAAQQLTVQILALNPPQQGPMKSAPTGGGVLQGTVLDSDGSRIKLQTGSGDLTVRTSASLPPGTKLILRSWPNPAPSCHQPRSAE